jgi:oligoendopeptidase F
MMRFMANFGVVCLATTVALTGLTAAHAGSPVTEWNLSEMYGSQEEFLAARTALEARLDDVAACRGRLGESAAVMLGCLDLQADLTREFRKQIVYASLGLDKDLRNADAQKLRAETERVGVQFSEASSWVEPEILELGKDKVDRFLAEEAGLQPHSMFLRDTVRRADHTLPPEQEALLAKVGLISGKFSDAYDQLTTSDLPYPEVELPDLEPLTLNQAAYVKYRGSPDRAVREKVFSEFWTTFSGYENTLGTLLNAEVQKNWFYAQARHYPSCLAAYLDNYNIPESVYTQLISDVHANLPVLHRMLKLRQQILGLETQGYHDIYASIVPAVDMTYPWQESKAILEESLAPLGAEYVATMSHGLDSWVDVYPADGKQSGAYSTGWWYDGHPWILMNYNDSYDSMATLAHEFGHAMHSWSSNKAQPFPKAAYSTMVAEVASTFNEYLLQHNLLADETDPTTRLFFLGSFLERLRQTVFRQTMFAEFQLEIHRQAEAGETLTGESMSELYLELLRKYHGHEQGVMEIADRYAVEWSFIPHFYRGFYVYQYATGMVASIALAEQAVAGAPGAVDRYLEFLSSGGSDYPIELLRAAGADLTTSKPFEIAMAAATRAMDEIEALLPELEAAD